MKPTKTRKECITTSADVAIGFEEAVVVCVEYSKAAGYLIAPSFTKNDRDSGLLLESVSYLYGNGYVFKTSSIDRVSISEKDGSWAAVDVDSVGLIPYPASVPYPVIYISNHGYRWMIDQTANRHRKKVWEHLFDRFEGCTIPRPKNGDRFLAMETYH